MEYPYGPQIETVDRPRTAAEQAEIERIEAKFPPKPMPKRRSSGSSPQEAAEQAYLDSVAGAGE